MHLLMLISTGLWGKQTNRAQGLGTPQCWTALWHAAEHAAVKANLNTELLTQTNLNTELLTQAHLNTVLFTQANLNTELLTQANLNTEGTQMQRTAMKASQDKPLLKLTSNVETAKLRLGMTSTQVKLHTMIDPTLRSIRRNVNIKAFHFPSLWKTACMQQVSAISDYLGGRGREGGGGKGGGG